jgi:GNAT superfamily N-acetyltransferase
MSTPAVTLRLAQAADAGEVLVLQRAAFVAEAQLYGQPDIQPLRDTTEQVRQAIGDERSHVLVAEATDDECGRVGRLLGSARLMVDPDGHTGVVGRIVVASDVQGRGLGGLLIRRLHAIADGLGVASLTLWTGGRSESNIAFYRRHGYEPSRTRTDDRGITLQVMKRDVPTGEPNRT